jgi:cell division septum initiation protein DivIVA
LIPRRGRTEETRRLHESYELIWRERDQLLTEVTMLRDQLAVERASHDKLERRLRDTLVFAENAAAKRKEETRHEAEIALRKARARANEILAAAQKRRDDIEAEARALERRIAERERWAKEAADERDAERRLQAELLLKKARERADEIVRAAEARRSQVEADVEQTRAGYRDFLAALERLTSEAGRTTAVAVREEPFVAETALPPSLRVAPGPPDQRPRN